MIDVSLKPRRGCVQHDCEKCQNQSKEIESLKAEIKKLKAVANRRMWNQGTMKA